MLNARDLVQMSIDEVWELPDGPMKLRFDDGVIETNTRATVFSRYIWEIHRNYPHTPMLMRHHIGDTKLGSNTHLDLLSKAIWDCFDAHRDMGGINMEDISKLAYDITNMIYNDTTVRLEEHVGSICILDFIDVIDHPVIAEAMDKVASDQQTSDHTVDKTYKVIKDVLLDPTQLIGNGVAKAAKSGLVSLGQILQCVGPRGLATDIDSHIFRNPILRGFVHGLGSLEDSMKESRSAAKALFFAKDPMAQSEYFNRNMQLSAATLSNIHQTDCGSNDFIEFYVKPGDIDVLEGIWFFDKDIKNIRPITRSDKYLTGKHIQIRSVFTCKHPDPYGICQRCFGELGLSVPTGTNIGHLSTSVLLGQVGQKILSTKHEDSSANVEELTLDEFERNYLKVGKNPNEILFADALVGKPFKVYFSTEEAKNIPELAFVDNVRVLTPPRISELTAIYIEIPKGKGTEQVALTVSTVTRKSSLSWAALEYIKTNGWSITNDGRYCIDMSLWKRNEPFVELPMKHFSTVDFMFAIASLLKGSGTRKGKAKSLQNYESISGTLVAVHELVNSKLKVNISHLQTIILTMMVRSEDDRDYRLPVDRLDGSYGRYKELMELRSLAPAMAYQGQTDIMFSPTSFIIKNRPRHPLDFMLIY